MIKKKDNWLNRVIYRLKSSNKSAYFVAVQVKDKDVDKEIISQSLNMTYYRSIWDAITNTQIVYFGIGAALFQVKKIGSL